MEVIKEENIASHIKDLLSLALSAVAKNDMKESIRHLHKAEVLIDTYLQIDGKISSELMLAVVMNLGVSFYRVGLFDEAFSCFENSDMRLKKKVVEKQQQRARKPSEQLPSHNEEDSLIEDKHFGRIPFADWLAKRAKRKRFRLALNM